MCNTYTATLYFFKNPLPPNWLLLGLSILKDPHPSQQYVGLQPAVFPLLPKGLIASMCVKMNVKGPKNDLKRIRILHTKFERRTHLKKMLHSTNTFHFCVRPLLKPLCVGK